MNFIRVPEQVIHKLMGKLEIPDFREAHEVEYIVDNESLTLTQ